MGPDKAQLQRVALFHKSVTHTFPEQYFNTMLTQQLAPYRQIHTKNALNNWLPTDRYTLKTLSTTGPKHQNAHYRLILNAQQLLPKGSPQHRYSYKLPAGHLTSD